MMIMRISDERVLVGEEVAASDNSDVVTGGGEGVTPSPLSDWLRLEALRSLCLQLRESKAKKRKAKSASLYKQIKSWMYPLGYFDIPDLAFIQMTHEPYVHCGNCNNVMTYSPKAEVVFYHE